VRSGSRLDLSCGRTWRCKGRGFREGVAGVGPETEEAYLSNFKSNWLRSWSEISKIVSKRLLSIGMSLGKTTFQLGPSGKTDTAMFGSPLQIFSISSLMVASSSAAVLEGFPVFSDIISHSVGCELLRHRFKKSRPSPLAIRVSACEQRALTPLAIRDRRHTQTASNGL
jgi:hypothetical protein